MLKLANTEMNMISAVSSTIEMLMPSMPMK